MTFAEYHRRKSPGTKEAQWDDLTIFSRYLSAAKIARRPEDLFSDPHAWAGMNESLLLGFRAWLLYEQPPDAQGMLRGYAPSSVKRYLSTVKQYCRLAYLSGAIPYEEWLLIKEVKADSHAEAANIDADRRQKGIIPRMSTKKAYAIPVDPQEFATLAHTTTSSPRLRERDFVLTKRDELLICLLGEHGLRVGEVVALNTESINVRNKTLKVERPKSHRLDTLELMDATRAAAEQYLPLIPEKGPLFYGYQSHRISRQGINKRVGVLGDLAHIPDLSPHDLRHYWTKIVFQLGNPLSAIKRFGGWESGHMPLHYAQEYGVEVTGLKVHPPSNGAVES
jgi:integrase